MEKEIRTLLQNLPDIIKNLIQGKEGEAYNLLSKNLNTLNYVMLSFINMIPTLNKMGLDISTEIITRQLKNVSDGCEFRDNILLADSLEYEIMESLQIYLEILGQMA